MRNSLLRGAAVLIVILAFPAGRAWGVMLPASTPWLARNADLVVVGTVAEVSGLEVGISQIVSHSLIVVEENIRGRAPGAEIIVEYAGGQVGQTVVGVSDAPVMQAGQRVLLFLQNAKSWVDGSPVYHVVAKAQGRYVIGDDGVATKSGFAVVQPPEKTRIAIDNNLPLADLLQTIWSVP